MLYNRLWFHKDLCGFTLGGGKINNPGRHLVLAEQGDFGQVSGGKTESYKKFIKMNVHRLTTSAVSDRLIRTGLKDWQKGRREAGSGWADGIHHCLSWLP
jgi:hypothetical protein